MSSKIILLVISFFCVSCGAPSALTGKWFAKQRECLLKDKKSRFKDTFGEGKKKHTLTFKENNQVQLTYPGLNVDVKQKGESKSQLCDVVITGTYSTSFFGGALYFDFKDDKTGKWQISKGSNCDLDQNLTLPNKMPTDSPYANEPSVSLITVNNEDLQLGFPNQTKCHKDQLIFIYSRE